jgi:hypothetical protein
MSDKPTPTGFSLRRWSQRKHAAARGEPELQRRPAKDPAATTEPPAEPAPVVPVPTPGSPGIAADSIAAARAAAETAMPLPSLQSLTIDSDFSPFMQPGVDEGLKRAALRKLLRHPRFNVMDGLDVYIDDYSKPSPLEPELVRTLAQARYIFDPPKTRVTAEGIVEDVFVEADAVTDEAGEGAALPPSAADPTPAVGATTSRVEDGAAVPPAIAERPDCA